MSLTLCVTTPEGIVLAADSRQTYRNNVGASRIGSDSATKIFAVNKHIGITVAGPAFLKDPDDPSGATKGIASYIQDFVKQLDDKATIKSVTEGLKDFLSKIYQPEKQLEKAEKELLKRIKEMKGNIVKTEKSKENDRVVIHFTDSNGKVNQGAAGIIPISLIVAGYDKPKKEEKDSKPKLSVYMAYIPGPTQHRRKHGDGNQFGASWTGQTDVVTRIILGRDPRAHDLEFVRAAVQNLGEQRVNDDLGKLEYIINWGAMTLHDAIDFASLMIETTSAIQRFSDGVKLAPGDMPGVGGPIDIAVILPYDGFRWHKKKELELREV